MFIDEIDAVGRHRGDWAERDECEQTLNQLSSNARLGINEGVIILAATNRLIYWICAVEEGRQEDICRTARYKGAEAIPVHAKGKPPGSDEVREV